MNSKPELTYKLALAAAEDHGNRQMRRNGRTAWNAADFSAASRKLDELLQYITTQRKAHDENDRTENSATRHTRRHDCNW